MFLFSVLPGAGFGILASLFATVARLYDVMLTLSKYKKAAGAVVNDLYDTTSDLSIAVYTLAGVVMLFRVTISLLNMLLDPDKISDKKTGAGKLLTRIMTSLIMLILLYPTGWVLNKETGVLARLEKALLNEEDGLITRVMPQDAKFDSPKQKDGLLIDNAYAVNSEEATTAAGYDCYYVYIKSAKYYQGRSAQDNGLTPINDESITEVAHITLYNNKTSGKENLCSNIDFSNSGCYSYSSDSNSPYSKITGDMEWSKLESSFPSEHTCPNRLEKRTWGGYDAYDGYGTNASAWTDVTGTFVGGWHSVDAMKAAILESGLEAGGENGKKIADDLGVENEASFVPNVSPEAVSFARSTLGSFVHCIDGNEECETLKANMLKSSKDNTAIKNELNKDDSSMDYDFLIGAVAGIGLCAWLIFLCVDIIIRRFKLLLLEVLAPIPIIAYSDPKDETFTKWGKMYLSTYAELFLKLIAISLAIVMLRNADILAEGSGELKFFYITAILLFAKMIPDIISNIFGIKISAGSFKDVMNMGKSVLGFAAGAAVGMGAAGVTGAMAWKATKGQGIGNRFLAGASALGSVFTGAARGAGSGSKGNVLGGARDVAGINANRRAKYAAGLTATHLLEAATLGKIGMDTASVTDRELAPLLQRKETLKDIAGLKSQIFSTAAGSDFMKTVYAWREAGHVISDDRIRSLAEAWAGEQVKMNRGTDGYRTDAWIESEKVRLDYDKKTDAEKRKIDLQLKEQKNNYNASIFKNHTSEYSDIYTSVDKNGDSDFMYDFTKIHDGGNAGAIDSMLKDTTAKLKGNATIAEIVGMTEINSVSEVGKLAANAWNKTGGINDIDETVRQKTMADPAYNAAKAANQAAGNDKK